MFIKVTTSGGRRYAQLVESFRNESGQSRQRTLATLGRLEPDGDVDRLIQALHRAQGREDAAPGASAAIKGLQFLESRSTGDVWALWQLWQSLALEGLALACDLPPFAVPIFWQESWLKVTGFRCSQG